MGGGFGLQGKTALVTGGARRIGQALCVALAREGADLLVHHCTSQAEAEELCDGLRAHGSRATAVGADLADPDECERLVQDCRGVAEHVDIIINSASSFSQSRLADVTPGEVTRAVQLHAVAPLQLVRGLMGIPATRPGRVVNLLDAYLEPGQRQHVAYNLGKRALQALTPMLAAEMAPLVTVNAVAPGMVLAASGHDDAASAQLAAANALRRVGEVEDVVQAVLYLLRADFVTGQVLRVDGGARLGR